MPNETERKFLIAMPDPARLLAEPGARADRITQTYLLSPRDVTLRVRRRETETGVLYTATKKRRLSDMTAEEQERTITEAQYRALLAAADPALSPIEKTRYTVPFGPHLLEVDVYPFWGRTAILEIELPSEDAPVSLPPYLTVLREVTADKRYKNVALAKAIPAEP